MKDMNKDLVKKSCTECGGKLGYRLISQGFERGGIKVRLGGIKAYVCSTCKEIYFMPGGADKVAKAANALFELAKAERQHKGQLIAQIS